MNHESKHVIAVLILADGFMEISEMIITLIKSALMFDLGVCAHIMSYKDERKSRFFQCQTLYLKYTIGYPYQLSVNKSSNVLQKDPL
jgi:hypothetical protein